MENKINIAELLKDCPKGMELDCTMFEDVKFSHINSGIYPIVILVNGQEESLTEYGHWDTRSKSKCVIFPKNKTTWEGFQTPFKDGDIVATANNHWIGITTGGEINSFIPTYCVVKPNNEFEAYFVKKETWQFSRLATEEEKQKLFDAIKANGYKWNAETKTLEKLIEPKFKVGDRIRHKVTNKDNVYEISKVYDDSYGLVGFTWMLYMKYQDQYELIPNKFNISTFKPFDKVLARDSHKQVWIADFFSHKVEKRIGRHIFACIGHYWYQCIPYEGNEHLLNKTDDCDDFYKTWE